MSSLSNLD